MAQDSGEGTARGTVETERGWRSRQARAVGGQPESAAWPGLGGGGRSFSMLGLFLVLIGLGLVVRFVQPAISLTSLVLLALGVAFGAVWLLSGVKAAFIPAALLVALALSRLVVELGVLTSEGLTSLFLGVALVAIWAVGRWQRARRDWALWLGVILVLVGLAQISLSVAGFQDLGLVWPALIILIGGVLLLRSRTGGARHGQSPPRRG